MINKFYIVAAVFLFTAVVIRSEPVFTGQKAFDYLIHQTDMGPRNPGSPGHQACLDWLIHQGRLLADTVVVQRFTGFNPYGDSDIPMANVIYRYRPHIKKRVMLMAHWDTRPVADLDLFDKDLPIPGANDGASGVAVLMHLAELFKQYPPTIGIDLAFWDGEDSGRPSRPEEFAQGSRFYSRNQIEPVPQKAILIDMIGDADLKIYYELYSLKFAPKLVTEIWKIARDMGFSDVFIPLQGPMVYDDHVPLSEKGIPSINIIDFQYPRAGLNYWHTHEDTPDKCSPQSLEIVGSVLLKWVYSQ